MSSLIPTITFFKACSMKPASDGAGIAKTVLPRSLATAELMPTTTNSVVLTPSTVFTAVINGPPDEAGAIFASCWRNGPTRAFVTYPLAIWKMAKGPSAGKPTLHTSVKPSSNSCSEIFSPVLYTQFTESSAMSMRLSAITTSTSSIDMNC